MPRARIRSIKPSFWVSGKILECSPQARLLFIGLWNFCDDEGRHEASSKQLKAEVYPGDECSLADVRGWVDELIANRLLWEYEAVHNGRRLRLWQVLGWDHQKISHPNTTDVFPPPPEPPEAAPDGIPELNPESTRNESGTNPERSPPDRMGRDGIGKDRKGGDGSTSGSEPSSDPALAVFIELPLIPKDGVFQVQQSDVDAWIEDFPAVDVPHQLRRMRAWADANPTKRKTRRGAKAFIVRWLSKAQDDGGRRPPSRAASNREAARQFVEES